MSVLDWIICCHSVQVSDRDGAGNKVVRLQSEVGHWIVGQYCHVYVLWRRTTGVYSIPIALRIR